MGDLSDHQNELSHSEDKPCDIMYGDEDSHHRPLDVNVYHNLDDLDEEDDEYDSDLELQPISKFEGLKYSQSLDRRGNGSKSMSSLNSNSKRKPNTTWNK